MSLFGWMGGGKSKAMSFYKKGMAKADKRDHQGALDEYTRALDVPNTPADVQAMVLYNRALVQVAAGDNTLGEKDLNEVLAMDAAPASVKSAAKQKLARMKSRADR